MTYQRFEDTPVWQAAQELGADVFALVEDRAFGPMGDLRNQLQRAVLSVSNNIAEGFERGSTNELIYYLYVARGSAGEVRSALHFADRLAERGVLKSQAADLRRRVAGLVGRCEAVSRQIRGWADSLQNSEIRGQRHLNDQTRRDFDQGRRSRAFLEKLERVRRGEPADGESGGTPAAEV